MAEKTSEVDACFNEGTNAVYMIIQLICPECNKLFRVSLLVNDKGARVISPKKVKREHGA